MSLPTKWPYRVKSGNTSVPIYFSKTARGYDEFKVVFYNQERKRRFKTFADFNDAKAHAAAVNATITSGDINALTLTSDDRLVYLRATEAIKPLNVTLDTAANEYAHARQKLGPVSLREAVEYFVKRNPASRPAKTVRKVCDEVIEAKKADGRTAIYLKNLKFHFDTFAAAFSMNIGDVTGNDVDTFLRSLKCAGRSRNNHRMAIRTIFRFAMVRGYVSKDHIDFDTIEKATETRGTIPTFTPKEMIALLDAATPDILPATALAAFAGVRTWEIGRMDWKNINLQSGFIRVVAPKGNTAQNRLIPISPNLAAWLTPHQRDKGPVCAEAEPDFPAVAAAAKITWKKNALRHSRISYRVAQTQDVAKVSLESGNSVNVIRRDYLELFTPDEGAAWFSIMPNAPANVISVSAARA